MAGMRIRLQEESTQNADIDANYRCWSTNKSINMKLGKFDLAVYRLILIRVTHVNCLPNYHAAQ